MNETLLAAKGLTKAFQSGHETLNVLENLDMAVAAGQSVSIVGASGSGKSTLLYLLGGLDRPTAGQVLYEGRPLAEYDETELAAWRNQAVGFVFQFHHLLGDFTALENVALPARLAGKSRAEAEALAAPLLERVGLGARLNHKPGEMSGGEQQRAALARALVNGPRLLLGDEPTGNLDNKSAGVVGDLIMELVAEKNLAAVIVTHNPALASLAHVQLELTAGRVTSSRSASGR